jgi:hypothetical protein
MNPKIIASIVVKVLLAIAGASLTLNWITPEQYEQISVALDGIVGAVTQLVSAGIVAYSVYRSVVTHKAKK